MTDQKPTPPPEIPNDFATREHARKSVADTESLVAESKKIIEASKARLEKPIRR